MVSLRERLPGGGKTSLGLANDSEVHIVAHGQTMWLSDVQGRRGAGGGEIARAPRFWGPLEIFCWAPVIFLGEIFPRKGQDICFFGQSTEIGYEKLS